MSDADDAVDPDAVDEDAAGVEGPAGPPEEAAPEAVSREVVRAGTDDESPEEDTVPPWREGVVDPEELDIRAREGVEETEDGRFVISTDSGAAEAAARGREGGFDDRSVSQGPVPGDVDAYGSGSPDGAGDTPSTVDVDGNADAGTEPAARTADADSGADETAGTADAPADPLARAAGELAALSAPHGLALAATADGQRGTLRVASEDPAETLAAALRWYAVRVDPTRPPEATVADLLAAADLAPDWTRVDGAAAGSADAADAEADAEPDDAEN